MQWSDLYLAPALQAHPYLYALSIFVLWLPYLINHARPGTLALPTRGLGFHFDIRWLTCYCCAVIWCYFNYSLAPRSSGSKGGHDLATSREMQTWGSAVPYDSSVLDWGHHSMILSTSQREPVLGKPSSTTVPWIPTHTLPVTTDGMCGVGHDNAICENWPQGGCCSQYGFCGDTSAHCGQGCQSGPCLSVPFPAPGPDQAPADVHPGSFKVVGQSGVPAMHAALLPNGNVLFMDKVENYTQIMFNDGYFAYSAEYDPVMNQAIGLSIKTNAFCSGGTFLADGTLISVGGNAPLPWVDPTVGNGFDAIRYLRRSSDNQTLNWQGWDEPGTKLVSNRWYASAQILEDGRVFVASGSLNGLDPTNTVNNNPTYEILNATGVSEGIINPLSILVKNQPYYMYPFIHLLGNGNLFILAAKSAEIFCIGTGKSVLQLPDLPGAYRTYPNTGGSVLLPLSSANDWAPDIIICGGGSYQDITSPGDASCGRIQPLAPNPDWEMDSMPEPRVMVEGTLLPDGTVLWVNGAEAGAQGFGLATDPALEVLIYNPTKELGQRWTKGARSNIARLYHSVSLLLLDGTLLVAGSNPNEMPLSRTDSSQPSKAFPTEFRVEIYTPAYLQGHNRYRRPKHIRLSTKYLTVEDDSMFHVGFTAPPNATDNVRVVLYHGGFVTHSLHMNQRMLFLDSVGWISGRKHQVLNVAMPSRKSVAPPGPYVLYVVVDGVPGFGQFVTVA